MRVRNTDYQRRTWPFITNKDTGTTLSLEAGGEADVDLDGAPSDPYLVPVRAPRASKAEDA